MNPDRRLTAFCLNCGLAFKYKAAAERGKYCTNKCQRDFQWKQVKKRIEAAGKFETVYQARRYLVERDGHCCAICSLEKWCGEPIPLVCDHINGDSFDWTISNCRMICCNCDAQTPTYKGKNKGRGRFSRLQRYHAGLSF